MNLASCPDVGRIVTCMVYVIARLEEAGAAMLAMKASGYGTSMRVGSLDVLREAIEGYGWTEETVRMPMPSAAAITRMDESYAWLGYIQRQDVMLRYVVGARSLVHPVSGKYLCSWRRLASRYGVDRTTVQRHHSRGIEIITARLMRDGFIFP